MSSDIAISVRNLTKTYRLFGRPSDRVKQAVTFGLCKYHKEFTALKDVSFEIKKGETVGILGRNGSGKSTLLQLICGILKPTSGAVEVKGRVTALLELGAGFNPDFNGRENTYFQGALMGLTKEEMDARFDDIATFADIGEFIDQPVRTYSSGMFVRLAFAVAINVSPDILIVDEALGVGDATFRFKCLNRIDSLRQSGCTILMVSHNLLDIRRVCSRGVVLQSGCIVANGRIDEAINEYEAQLNAAVIAEQAAQGGVRDVKILTVRGIASDTFRHGEDIVFSIALDRDAVSCDRLTLVCNLVSPAYGCISSFSREIDHQGGRQIYGLRIKSPPILRGAYVLNTTLLGGDNSILGSRRNIDSFTIVPDAAEARHWSTTTTEFIAMESEWLREEYVDHAG